MRRVTMTDIRQGSDDPDPQRAGGQPQGEIPPGLFRQHEEFRRGLRTPIPPARKMHKPLLPIDSELVSRVRFRLGGRDMAGNPIDPELDVRRFCNVEDPFVHWLDRLQAGSRLPPPPDGPERLPNGLNRQMEDAIAIFHNEGGHAGRLSPEQIRTLLKQGMIIMIGLEVREDIVITIGSICALSRPPLTAPVPQPGEERDLRTGLHKDWPQYDLRDAFPPDFINESIKPRIGEIMVLCRSSVRNELRTAEYEGELQGTRLPDAWEGESLRRLGIAGAAKDILFRAAYGLGSSEVVFNIGAVGRPGQQLLNIYNVPSRQHNDRSAPMGYRQQYNTILCDDPKIRMYWTVYHEMLKDDIEILEQENGLLLSKGWDLKMLRERAVSFTATMRAAIARGDHAAWGTLDNQTAVVAKA
ncbi:MAG: hypothetical protein G01um101425_428 [Candidatus Peregrinibacteria bacterium Gr01-1014_25]|nr:MAG: hypothetical protein G01um101425_428 [Candidatus Peregrinibacteria bacterium Gr01-1014_25]